LGLGRIERSLSTCLPSVVETSPAVTGRPPAPVSGRQRTLDHKRPLTGPVDLAELLECLPDALVAVGGDGRIIAANALAERLFGYDRAGLNGESIETLVPRHARAGHRRLRAAYTAVPRSRPMGIGLELVGLRKDGSEFPAEISLSPTPFGNGTIVLAAVRDHAERNALLAKAQEIAHLGSWEWDPTTGEERWSVEAYNIFGLVPGSVTTHDAFLAAVHPGDRARVSEMGDAASRGESGYDIKYRVVQPVGGARHVHATAEAQRDESGRIVRLAGFVQDVTGRRRSHEALRASEASLARAQAIAHLGSWDWDVVTGALQWSDEIYRIFGVAPREFGATYDAFLACVHPDDREHVQQAVNAAVHERQPYSLEHRVVRPDGSERTVHEQGEVSYDASGTPVRMVGIVHDVTERALAERALRDSEKRYRDLYENASDIIYSNDLEGRFLTFNPAGERILGYRREELLGRHFAAFVAPEHVEPTTRQMRRKLAGDVEATTYEVDLLRKDGARVPVEISSRVVLADGRPVGIEGVARDVTERKRAEQARHELEEQLRHAQKIEALGRLAGGVAHDFNNLLTAIAGYSQLLLDRTVGEPKLRPYVEEIHRAAERGASLTRQLLAFGRRQVLQPRVLDLNEVVKGSGEMIRRLIGESVELELRLAPRLGRVFADRSQLEQVLLNLSVNARDAMPDGGTLTFATENADGHRVRLAVSDTGTGIDPEAREHLFEPFFTTKEPGKGTGLGLATVLGVVEQSGGTITLESEPGAGTTFSVYLPRVLANAEPVEPESAAGSSDASGTETVLVAEDDQAVRDLCRRLLQGLGYTVLVARDGVEALELCTSRDGPIHLLVTDVVMPRLGGRELGQRVSALRPEMPVIYTSGYTETAFGEDGTLPRGVAFLPKPFTGSSLAGKVREVLDRAARAGR